MTNTCATHSCGQPVDDAWVCSSCAGLLEKDLAEVPSLATDLDLVLARLTNYGDRVSGRTNEKTIPYDPRASETKTQLHGLLVSWVRLCWEERYPVTGNRSGYPAYPKDELGSLAVFLLPQVEWLRHHQAGHEAVEEIGRAIERTRQVVDRPAGRWYAGICGSCQEDLYAKLGALWVSCRCGATYDVAERREWLLSEVEDVLCCAADMSRALTTLDQPVTAERIRKWRERGRILVKGRDNRGQPLYRVGDVRDLLIRQSGRARFA